MTRLPDQPRMGELPLATLPQERRLTFPAQPGAYPAGVAARATAGTPASCTVMRMPASVEVPP